MIKKRGVLVMVVATFLFIFLSSVMVSASEFDNRGVYNHTTRTITIRNMFNLGDHLAEIKLMSPDPYHVGAGDDVLVAWYNLQNFKTYDGNLVFSNLETYLGVRGSVPVFKPITYKMQVEKSVNETTCTESGRFHANGSLELNCVISQHRIHGWEDFGRTASLRPGNYTIGLFTEVGREETVEWIPTMYGVRDAFEVWATWTADLNEGILSYYYMNESSGNERDWVNGENNITIFAGSTGRGSTGIVNGSANMTHLPTGSYFETTQMTGWNVTNGTIAMWINWSIVDALPDQNFILWGLYNTGENDSIMVEFDQRDAVREIEVFLISEGAVQWSITTTADFGDANPPRSEWTHFALRHNGTDAEMFLNGSSIWNNSAFTITADKTAWWRDVINSGADVMAWGANRSYGATGPNWNGSFDEIGIWDRGLTETEIFDIYNDTLIFGAGVSITVTNEIPSDASILVSSPVSFNGTIEPSILGGNTVNLTNATLIVYNSSGMIFNDTVVNQVSGTVLNSSGNLTILSMPFDEYNWSILGCTNGTSGTALCGISSNFTLTIQRFAINNQSFRNLTTEGASETFQIFLNTSSGLTFTPTFFYNNTNEGTGLRVDLGNNSFTATQTINVPAVSIGRNKTFFWRLDFSDGFSTNTTPLTQEVLDLSIDNCTTNSFQIFNYTLVDEAEQTDIDNPELEIALNLYTLSRNDLLVNFSLSTNSTPLGICSNTVFFNDTSYSLDTVVKYTAPNYAVEYYNIDNSTVNNNTENQNIVLYDLNATDSTEFLISFTGSDFLPATDTLVFLDRQYIPENLFKTVELPKTDPNGKAILHMVTNDVVYNIRLIKGGSLIGNFPDVIAFCPAASLGDCELSLVASSALQNFTYNNVVGIIFTLTPVFNNVTNEISFDFIVSDGTQKLVSLNVSRHDVFGNQTVCTNSLEAVSGTLSCAVDPSITNTFLRTEVAVEGKTILVSGININRSDFGSIGYVAWFVLTLTFILVFGDSKSGILWSMVISYIGAIVLGITRGDIIGVGSAGIWIIVITSVGLWRINRERPQ